MIELLFLLFACIILAKSSEHDYRTMFVEWYTPFIIIGSGIAYMLLSGNNIINTICIVIIIAFLFALPSFFSFGMGDFLIFIGLGFFIDSEASLSVFLGTFLILWLFWTLLMLNKLRKKDKRYWKVEYPLVPVIAMAFYIWIIFSVIR